MTAKTKREEAALRVVERYRRRVDYLEDFTARTLAASWASLERNIRRDLKSLKYTDTRNLPQTIRYQMDIEPVIRLRAENYAREAERVMLSLAEVTADLGAETADKSARRITGKRDKWERVKTSGLLTGPLLSASKEAIKRIPGTITQKISELVSQAAGMAEQGLNWVLSQLGDVMGNLWSGIQRTVRTLAEQMFRRAQQEQAKKTPVRKWRRIANHETACLACLMLEGTIYDKEEDFADHPNGRCTIVPVEDPNAESTHPGRDWFLEQDEETQRKIMGKGRWEAWQNGDISLDEMVDVVNDPIYGPLPHIKPLKAFGLTP